ncbi:hypothetical protein [Bowmanella denitrificans]
MITLLGLYSIKCMVKITRSLVSLQLLAILIMAPSISNASDEIEWECLATEFPMYLEAKLDIEKNRILFKAKSGEKLIPTQWKATVTAKFNSLIVGTIFTTTQLENNIKDAISKDIELTEGMINISWGLLEVGRVCDWSDSAPKGSLNNNTNAPATICGIGTVMLPAPDGNQKIILKAIDEKSWTPVEKFTVSIESLDDSWEDSNEESSDVNCE